MSVEGLLSVLNRAAADTAFYGQLAQDGAKALQGYDLTAEERNAVATGDLGWIESRAGHRIDERVVATVLIPLLSREHWCGYPSLPGAHLGSKVGICQHCGRRSPLIAQALGVCGDCTRQEFDAVRPAIVRAHAESRRAFGLPPHPPRDDRGIACGLCANDCRVPSGGRGFCGLRQNVAGQLVGASEERGNVSWYHDALPANCVASWVCPGGMGAGHPDSARGDGPEGGCKNLAVFYQACNFDCLSCQNWHFRYLATGDANMTASELAEAVDGQTACICHFGGEPTAQLPFALRVSRLALEKARGRTLRICWETNGSTRPDLLKQSADLSLESGGCVKFNFRTWSEGLHFALCGVGNQRPRENFELLAEYCARRPSPPFLIASTVLVPGYVDVEEVSHIAAFISSLNPGIPYALLAFHPRFAVEDLPPTSRRHADECLAAAKAQGLTRVRLGNAHLLGEDY